MNNENLKLESENSKEKVYRCECCGNKVKIYNTRFSKMHLQILFKIIRFTTEEKKHEFRIKEIEWLLTKSEYAIMNNLCHF